MNEEDQKGQTKDPFKEDCFILRDQIEGRKKKVALLKNHPHLTQSGADRSEIQDNIQLAFRHLEDARMRIGKAIQAYDSGTSCYPR